MSLLKLELKNSKVSLLKRVSEGRSRIIFESTSGERFVVLKSSLKGILSESKINEAVLLKI